jgi:hypothetical protein
MDFATTMSHAKKEKGRWTFFYFLVKYCCSSPGCPPHPGDEHFMPRIKNPALLMAGFFIYEILLFSIAI